MSPALLNIIHDAAVAASVAVHSASDWHHVDMAIYGDPVRPFVTIATRTLASYDPDSWEVTSGTFTSLATT